MTIDHPRSQSVPALRQLWKDTFADTDAFLDAFFATAYSPDRCLCVTRDEEVLAAVYWLDCTTENDEFAYLYALAVRADCRGNGIGSRLMAHTHATLEARGYRGALLVPQEARLVSLYSRLGYQRGTTVSQFSCTAGTKAAALTPLDSGEFARLRRALLPEGALLQEGESLAFLDTQAEFFAGSGFLLAARRDGCRLTGLELLGDAKAAPEILRTLDCAEGTFRCPGGQKPFTMFRSLGTVPTPLPTYFAFAFD